MQGRAANANSTHRYVEINRIWDRTSKPLICLVDGLLTWFF